MPEGCVLVSKRDEKWSKEIGECGILVPSPLSISISNGNEKPPHICRCMYSYPRFIGMPKNPPYTPKGSP